jgi:type IV pilus assembly protein PilM
VKKIQMPPMGKDELGDQIPLEAEQHIPFKRDEVDIDHQVVTPRNAQGQMEVILVAAKKEMIADTIQVIRDAKLQPVVMDVAAFSVQNAYEAAYGTPSPTAPVALIHVGHAITHVNIIAGGISVFARDVTVGGAAFTEEIQRRLHLAHDEAEAFKLALGEPAAERSLDFFLASAPEMALSRLYLSGGAVKVAALVRHLTARAKVPVEILDPFKKMVIDPARLDVAFVRAHAVDAAVAVGLALRRPGDRPA